MNGPVFRYDLTGNVISLVVEDCAFCGADVTLAGDCSARCEASRRMHKADAARQERQG